MLTYRHREGIRLNTISTYYICHNNPLITIPPPHMPHIENGYENIENQMISLYKHSQPKYRGAFATKSYARQISGRVVRGFFEYRVKNRRREGGGWDSTPTPPPNRVKKINKDDRTIFISFVPSNE